MVGSGARARRRALVLLAVALVAVGPLLSPVVQAQATASAAAVVRHHWGPPGAERSVSPGDDGVTLTVILQNERDQTYHFLRAQLGETDGLWPTHSDSDVDTFQGPFKQGDTWAAQFTVDVNETVARDETLTVPLSLRLYTDRNNLTDANRRNVFHNLRVPILGSPSITVEAAPTRLPAAAEVPVTLTLINHGDGGASQIEVAVAPPSTGQTTGGSGSQASLVLASGSHTTLNRSYLGPGATATVPIRVLTPQSGGTYHLSATLTYTNTAGAQVTQAASLGFVVRPLTAPPLGVQLTDAQLEADRPGTLPFEVTNHDAQALGDVTLDIRLPAASPGTGQPPVVATGPTTLRVGDLDPGASSQVSLPVLVAEGALGTQSVTVVASWEDDQGMVRDWTFPLGIRVDGAIELSIVDPCAALDPEGPRLVAGGFVVNTGTAPARNTLVRTVASPAVDASAPAVLDDVAPHQPRSFTVESHVDERTDEGSPDQVEVVLTWTDDQGQDEDLTVTIPLSDARRLPADSLCEDELDDASEDDPLRVPGPSALVLVALLTVIAAAHARRPRW